MATKCQAQLVGTQAMAVVNHLDQTAAAVLDAHRDPRRPSVEAVLDQFLHHCGGAFDDFAGRDLVGDQIRQQADLRRLQIAHRSVIRAASGPCNASA